MQRHTHKFNVGDKVRIIKYGSGCHSTTVGEIVTIAELGRYENEKTKLGYRIEETHLKTNSWVTFENSGHNRMIGESSFELYKSPDQILQEKIESEIESELIKNRNSINLKKSNIMSTKVKNLNKSKVAEERQIETSLINKEEIFKMLALAESIKLPILLVGVPGTGKTKTVVDYAKAYLNKDGKMTVADFMQKLYILETDEGTKSSEVKGMPDLEKLFVDNKYEIMAPIASSDIVVINEVDKASSNVRNSLLGVMNEKFLFNGKSKIPCNWQLFVATCNEIPKEEENSPFWDRFMLKVNVSRISAGEMTKYYANGAKNYSEKFVIGVPSQAEIDALDIPSSKLEKFLEVGYNKLSDRTLTFVPNMAKAVSYIWNISIDKALVKVASIMINNSAGSELQNKLYSPEVKALMSKIEQLNTINTAEEMDRRLVEIEGLIAGYASQGRLDESQVAELEASVHYIIDASPIKQRGQDIEDILSETFSQQEEEMLAESPDMSPADAAVASPF
jgi:DNA replication protein DnaC